MVQDRRYNLGVMKCLTLHAQWAEAIFALGKDVENRSWATTYRGPLAIHASQRLDVTICEALGLDPSAVRTGAILGVVTLIDCVTDSHSLWALPGQFHWLFENPRRCDIPIPFKGQRGLFAAPDRARLARC